MNGVQVLMAVSCQCLVDVKSKEAEGGGNGEGAGGKGNRGGRREDDKWSRFQKVCIYIYVSAFFLNNLFFSFT